MQTMVRLRAARWISCLLVSLFALPYMGSAAVAASKAESDIPAQTVVLFPLDTPAGMNKDKLVSELQSFLVDSLSAGGRYQVVQYNDRLPAVQRLVAMQPDKKLTTAPFSTDAAAVGRAAVISKAMSVDLFIVGSVDQYTFNEKDSAVEMTASVQLMEGKTGKVLDTIVVTGRGTKPSASAPGTEETIASEAVKDAGRHIVERITGDTFDPAPVAQPVITKSKNDSKKSWLPLLLLSLGVGLLLGGSGGSSGSGGGSGIDAPPPPPF